MSNYLNNLITRLTETAVTLQPRPYSIYEPTPSTVQLSLQHDRQEALENDRDAHLETMAVVTMPETLPKPPIPPAAPPPIFAREPQLSQSRPIPQTSSLDAERPAKPSPSLGSTPLVQSEKVDKSVRKAPIEPQRLKSLRPDNPPAQKAAVTEQIKVITPPIQEVFVSQTVEKASPPLLIDTQKAPTSMGKPLVRPRIQPARALDTAVPENPSPVTDSLDTKADRQPPIIEQTTIINRPVMPDLSGTKKKARVAEPEQKPFSPRELQTPASMVRPATANMPVLPRLPQQNSGAQLTVPPPIPTVHVHIGRIEVRATPPPAAKPSKRQRESQVMSLDDYLRQRNGQGGKR